MNTEHWKSSAGAHDGVVEGENEVNTAVEMIR